MAAPGRMSYGAGMALLEIRNLSVVFPTGSGMFSAVDGVDLDVEPGEVLGIVGESGSGKSVAMLAVMGLVPYPGVVSADVLAFDGIDLRRLSPRRRRQLVGKDMAMIFQEPVTSLNPCFTVGFQLTEALKAHIGGTRRWRRERAIELLDRVGIPAPAQRLRAFPHQLSGGMCQRVMIAMAISCNPRLLIADEPTTALDVTIQAQILDLLRDLQRQFGMAIVFITHDLGIVRAFADRVHVMHAGRVVEHGPAQRIFTCPEQTYTRMLLAAEPAGHKPPPPPEAATVLEARSIRVSFDLRGGLFGGGREIRAVDGVSLRVREGQTLGIVGESGSGKSTLGRALLRLLPSEGQILYRGRDISRLPERELRPLRREMQLVFQDPYGSLSPRMTVGEILAEGLLVHEPELDARERQRRAAEALVEVQLDPAMLRRYPHEFSGGQRQRIAIARALILRPRLLVLDEPTSALDRSVQKQIVELLRTLQERHGLTYLFVSHDLAMVRALADTVMVMKDGRVVEFGPTEEIFDDPHAEYTRTLMAAALGYTRAGMAEATAAP